MHSPALRPLVGVAAFVLALVASSASAQDERWTPQLGPNVIVSATGVSPADVEATGQRYGFRAAGLGLAVPVAGGWNWDGTDFSAFRLMVHGAFRVDSATIPFAAGDRQLFAMEAGVSAVHVIGKDNQITWSAGVSFAEDTAAPSTPKPRAVGRVIAVHRASDTLTLLYGGAYTFITGRGRAIPVFGVLWRPRPGTSVTAIAPLEGRLRQRAGAHLTVGVRGGLHGNQYRTGDNARFTSATDELYFRVREVRVGGEVGLVIARSLTLVAEAGVATARKVTFADGKTELLAASAGTQPYFTIGVRVSVGKTDRWD